MRILNVVAGAAMLACGWVSMAQAQAATVRYTANASGNFTSTTNHTVCSYAPCEDYTTSDSVSGWFEIDQPERFKNLDGSTNVAGLITAFSFSDGINTFSSGDTNIPLRSFLLATDGNADITGGSIDLQLWQTGSKPHAVHSKVAWLTMAYGTQDSLFTSAAYHYLDCNEVAATTDVCNIPFTDGSTASAKGARLVWAKAAVPVTPVTPGALAVPSLSEWGLLLTTLGVAGFGMRVAGRKRLNGRG